MTESNRTAAGLTANASSPPVGTAEPAAAHPQGGLLRYATVSEPTTFDPHKGTSGGDHVSLYPIYDTLLKADPETLAPLPGLATEWEFIDETDLRLVLRQGVQFHDGTPFNADAVVYNIERGVNMEDSSVKPELSSVESAEATGEYEVVVHLKQPDGSLLGVFADRAGMMVSPTAAEADPDFGRNHPVGTGPHTFVEWRPGDTWTYERNPNYWQDGLPYLDGLQISLIPESTTRVNGLRSGQFDFVDSLEPSFIAELEGADGIKVVTHPTLQEYMVWWNVGRAPLDDARVRRALNIAIDRQGMWDAGMDGTGEIAWLPVPSSHWAYTASLVPSFPYDPEAARDLLAEAGYPDGFTLNATSANGADAVRRAEIIQANWAAIGVTLNVTPQQTVDSVQEYFESHNADAYITSMTARPDPSITFQTIFSANSYHNTSGWSPDGFEELLAEAKAAQGQEARAAVFAELNQVVVDEALWVPLIYPDAVIAMTDGFDGFTPTLIGKPDFLSVYQTSD